MDMELSGEEHERETLGWLSLIETDLIEEPFKRRMKENVYDIIDEYDYDLDEMDVDFLAANVMADIDDFVIPVGHGKDSFYRWVNAEKQIREFVENRYSKIKA